MKGKGFFGRYRVRELPALLRTQVGRSQLRSGLQFRLWPVYSRVAALYRRTRLRNVRVIAVVGSLGKTTSARAFSVALGREIDPLVEFNHQSCIAMALLRGGVPEAAVIDSGNDVLRAVAILRDVLQAGDVVLIKGLTNQRMERISLALAGRQVRCNISRCRAAIMICASCPMLERGWDGIRVVH